MALTIAQELEVLQGAIGPDDNTLSELVYQTAIGEAVRLSQNAKNPTQGTDEFNYLQKVGNIGNRIVDNSTTTIEALRKILVSLIGDSVFTYNQVANASDSDWEGFISTNIKECFEIAGGVLPHEKTAYDAL